MIQATSRWPWPALLGDLGGTHLRLAILGRPGGTPGRLRVLKTADYDDLGDAIADYLRLEHRSGEDSPASLAIALAAPAEPARRGPVMLTNDLGFRVDGADLARRFDLKARWIVNDFEAQAWAAATLTDADLATVGPLAPTRDATMAVIGPGTGLGCAALVRIGDDSWQALPGEGGHVTIAPRTTFEREVVLAALEDESHLSAERLLSGLGLPLLHRAVGRVSGQPVPDPGPDAPAITDAAQLDHRAGRTGTVAQTTVDVFFSLLGGYAGNVALTYGARGGVLIGGGIVNRLADLLDRSAFRARFEDKGRFAGYLRDIGTARIIRDQPALDGLAWAITRVAERLPVQYR